VPPGAGKLKRSELKIAFSNAKCQNPKAKKMPNVKIQNRDRGTVLCFDIGILGFDIQGFFFRVFGLSPDLS
jgi:hypothetical protein